MINCLTIRTENACIVVSGKHGCKAWPEAGRNERLGGYDWRWFNEQWWLDDEVRRRGCQLGNTHWRCGGLLDCIVESQHEFWSDRCRHKAATTHRPAKTTCQRKSTSPRAYLCRIYIGCRNGHTLIRLTALCPGLPVWAGTRKVEPIWILLKQEAVNGSGIYWHQLGRMQVCTLLQTDNHASTPPLSFLQDGCPSCHPTNSVKALKHWFHDSNDKKQFHISTSLKMATTGLQLWQTPVHMMSK